MSTENQSRTYHGNCHCAAYRFTVELPELKSALECNCSLCHKHGALWTQKRLSKNAFTVVKDGELCSYEFGDRTIEYKFCPICGTLVLGYIKDGPSDAEVILNIHCLQDVDFWSLNLTSVDNTWRSPSYVPAPPPSHQLVPDETTGEKLYTGSCHCGAVALAFKSKKLDADTTEVKECNCSYCIRNGWLLTYPNKPQMTLSGQDTMTTYAYGKKFLTQHFCRACGVNIFSSVNGPPEHVTRDWTGAKREMLERKLALMPLNVRVLDMTAEEWSRVAKRALKEDGSSEEPVYSVE